MTMRQVCALQLRRLPANLPNGPESDADRKAYLNAFEKHSKSETHATMVIDSLIETCQFYPKISEIVTACGYIEPALSLPPACGRCHGCEWVVVVRNGYDGASRCDCERGRYLANRDKERKAAA